MSIRRYTTARQTLTVEGVDLSEATDVVVTYKQGDFTINKHLGSYSDFRYVDGNHIIGIVLSPEESAEFSTDRKIAVQVNWKKGNVREATDIVYIDPKENLFWETI